MTIIMNGCRYSFRECDVKGLSEEQLLDLAKRTGRMQYEPNMVWLLIPSVGYGMQLYGLSD